MLISSRKIYETFLLKDRVSYLEFDAIIKKVLKLVRDKMINGEKVQTPFGTFSIREKERKFDRLGTNINIVESMKEKKRILEEGGVPYKVTKNAEGKIIDNNGGEKYFRYFTEDTFFSIVLGAHMNRYINIGKHTYKFTPAASTERLRRKELKEDKLITLKYAES